MKFIKLQGDYYKLSSIERVGRFHQYFSNPEGWAYRITTISGKFDGDVMLSSNNKEELLAEHNKLLEALGISDKGENR